MTQTRKAKVGLLGLMFELYDRFPELKPEMAEFAGELPFGTGPGFPFVFRGLPGFEIRGASAFEPSRAMRTDRKNPRHGSWLAWHPLSGENVRMSRAEGESRES